MKAQITIDIKLDRATGNWRVEVVHGGKVVARGTYDSLRLAHASAKRIQIEFEISGEGRRR